MKKALLAGLFGLATIASSYGNGNIIFDNYDCTPYMPVEYRSNHVGVADSNYHLDLLYALGTQSTTSGMTDLNLSVPINPSLMDTLGNRGYISGQFVVIPGYVSGPVSFAIEAWDTAGPGGGATYALAGENFKGISGVWQESQLEPPSNPANFFAGLPGPNGAPLLLIGIPEPSLFALTGIGAVALMITRRRLALK